MYPRFLFHCFKELCVFLEGRRRTKLFDIGCICIYTRKHTPLPSVEWGRKKGHTSVTSVSCWGEMFSIDSDPDAHCKGFAN